MLSHIQTNLKNEPRSVNCAGTINRNNKLWEVPAEEFDSVIDTNLKGTANVLRYFIPLMLEKKQGVIVNMSSGWGRSGAAQVKLSFFSTEITKTLYISSHSLLVILLMICQNDGSCSQLCISSYFLSLITEGFQSM